MNAAQNNMFCWKAIRMPLRRRLNPSSVFRILFPQQLFCLALALLAGPTMHNAQGAQTTFTGWHKELRHRQLDVVPSPLSSVTRCPDKASAALRSTHPEDGQAKALENTVVVDNRSGERIRVLWLDHDGATHEMRVLKHGERATFDSVQHHAWRATLADWPGRKTFSRHGPVLVEWVFGGGGAAIVIVAACGSADEDRFNVGAWARDRRGVPDLHVVDGHGEALPWWIAARNRGVLGPGPGSLVHIDSHPDIAPPHTLWPRGTNFSWPMPPTEIRKYTTINDFIVAASMLGLLDDVLFLMPPWKQDVSQQMKRGIHLDVGNNSKRVVMGSKDWSFGDASLWFAAWPDGYTWAEYEQHKPLPSRLPKEERTAQLRFRSAHLSDVVAPGSAVFKLGGAVREAVRPGKPVVLDVCFDAFSCENHEASQFREQYGMLPAQVKALHRCHCESYCESQDASVTRLLELSRPSPTMDEIDAARTATTRAFAEVGVQLRRSSATLFAAHRVDPELVDAEFMRLFCGWPVHYSEHADVTQIVEQVRSVLQRDISVARATPVSKGATIAPLAAKVSVVTLALSSEGYTPKFDMLRIEHDLLPMLLDELDFVHNNGSLVGAGEEAAELEARLRSRVVWAHDTLMFDGELTWTHMPHHDFRKTEL